VEDSVGQSAWESGLITANFFVDTEFGVVDHHFGVLPVP